VREKYEACERRVRFLQAAWDGAAAACREAEAAHRDATRRLAKLEEEYSDPRDPRAKHDPRRPQRIEDLKTEIAHHASRRDPLVRERDVLARRLNTARQLHQRCTKHLEEAQR